MPFSCSRGGLNIGPGLVLAATHFEIASVDMMPTIMMMKVRAALENGGMRLLSSLGLLGNFVDDAGGVAGARPKGASTGGGVYLTLVYREQLPAEGDGDNKAKRMRV